MPLKWKTRPSVAPLPHAPEEPKIVLAAAGSITPRHRLSKVLAAGSLLAVAFRPSTGLLPLAALNAPAGNNYLVINNQDDGPGSLRQAIQDANDHPGADSISFAPQVSGTISLITGQLRITDTVNVQGPGPGKLSVSGSLLGRVFYLYTPTHVPFTSTISGLTVRDGVMDNSGGGIMDWDAELTLDNMVVFSNTSTSVGGGVALIRETGVTNSLTVLHSVITGNTAAYGGGIGADGANDGVLIEGTVITNNIATKSGGGVYLYSIAKYFVMQDSAIISNSTQAPDSVGGGLTLSHSTASPHTIRRSTIAGNQSQQAGGGLAVQNVGGPLLIENSTVSGNQADLGGGAYLENVAQPVMQNSTVVSNSAVIGGGIDTLTTTLPVTNSIIANNSAETGPDISGAFQLRYDLVQISGTATISNAGGNLFGLDPMLGPLANNGGPTKTHLPGAGSPVLNTGDPAFAEPPSTDQRGDPRVRNGRVDMGAVEVAIVDKLFLPLTRR